VRFAITLRRGGGVQRYDCNYSTMDAAVFGVLRKESARPMAWYSSRDTRGPGQQTLEIHVEPNAAFDLQRPLSKGARLYEGIASRAAG
jgi:hypothetical protein